MELGGHCLWTVRRETVPETISRRVAGPILILPRDVAILF
jgi:hypothetical protein